MQIRTVKRLGFMAASAAMGILYAGFPVLASAIPVANSTSDADKESTQKFQLLMQQYSYLMPSIRTFLVDNQISIQMVEQSTITETRRKLHLNDENEACAWVPEQRLLKISAAHPTAGLGHAIGHALDTLLCISSKANFQTVYHKESGNLPLTGAVFQISSAEEYFAEAFNVYAVNPLLLREKCPETYAYMEALENKLDKQETERVQLQKSSSHSATQPVFSKVNIGFDPRQILDLQNQAKIAIVSEYWQKVPTPVQSYLGSKHVGIIMEEPVVVAMRTAAANGSGYDEHVVGVWLPDANAISVGYNMPEISLCHEVGHALDEYTKASATPEFYQIYLAEKGLLQSSGSSNYVNSKEEYFGEAFNQYCLRKDLLKETCPQTYAYIDSIVSSIL